MTAKRALDLESTGDRSFDAILGGGIPSQSVVLIAGEPGSGKTVLTLQMLFHAARAGKKCLYFTTLSEPTIKVIRYAQLFDFFDDALVDAQIVFANLNGVVKKGAEATLGELSAMIEKHQPAFLAIDSFRALADLTNVGHDARSFVYDFAAQAAAWGVTTLLVGEYFPDDMSEYPEFAIADGILRLGAEKQELTTVRELEVLKLRGMGYVQGQHFLEITKRGVFVYQRVRVTELPGGATIEQLERASTGVKGLDVLFGGGIPRKSATVIIGPTGSGKTTLGLQFLIDGAHNNERAILFTLEETPDQLRAIALGLGWDLPELERNKLVTVRYTSPVELSTDRYLQTARDEVAAFKPRRVFFDSLTSMQLGVPSERRFKELAYALCKLMRAEAVTLVLTMESAQLVGALEVTGHGVSFVADNLVQLRYLEMDGRLERALSILKARGIKHESKLQLLKLDHGGVRLAEPTTPARGGVLTGKRPSSTRRTK